MLRIWNATTRPITLDKNTHLGECCLILMKSKAELFNEMAHLAEGARADEKEVLAYQVFPMSNTNVKDKEWIVQEFHLEENEFL